MRQTRLRGLLLAFVSMIAQVPWTLGTNAAEQSSDAALTVSLADESAAVFDPASIVGGELRIVRRDATTELRVGALERRDVPPVTHSAWRPLMPGSCYIVADFEFTSSNRLGGRFADFSRPRLKSHAYLTDASDGRRVLRLKYRREEGHGGLRIDLYDPEPLDGTLYYLDTSEFDTLVLWVRGVSHGAALQLRLADDHGTDDPEAGTLGISLGALADFVPGGKLNGHWQRAVIPLARLAGVVDRTRLAQLSIDASGAGDGELDLERLALCRGSELADLPSAHKPSSDAPAAGQSLWAWSTRELIADVDKRDRFAEFVRAQRFARVYLQLPGNLVRAATDADVRTAAATLQPVVASIVAAGAQAVALDGAADFARAESHDKVAAAVRNVVRYNRYSGADARFTGVHYDVEPYLLPEFRGATRSQIVASYLQMIDRISEQGHAGGLQVEVAIPFWFDSVPVITESAGTTYFRPLSELVIDRADSVAIMDYRTRADGSGGTIAMAHDELDYASGVGKQVWVGLETTGLPDEEIIAFSGDAQAGLPTSRGQRGWVIAAAVGAGWSLYLVADDQLAGLQSELERLRVPLTETHHWAVKKRTSVPADRLTFATLGADRLQEVMRESADAMARHSAFAGFAIHYYRTYSQMLEQQSLRR